MPRSPRMTHVRFHEAHRQTRNCPTGGQRRPPLQDVLRFRRKYVQFCDCVLRGRGRTPPLRHVGQFYVFTSIAANPQLPHGRTEVSAPTERFSFSPMVRAILRLHTAGESAASTPTEILRCRRLLCGFGGAPCAGGASPSPTLRRNVVTAQNVPPFSSSGASRHLPLKGKALGCGGLSVAFPLYVWYCNSIHSPADHNCFRGSELRRILC